MNNYRNFSNRSRFNSNPRPTLGTSVRVVNGSANVGGLTVAASSGAKEMLGDPANGFFPVVLERLNDGTSALSGNVLQTKTIRAMISREGACARVNATGPFTCPEIEKVAVGEEFLALGETIGRGRNAFFRVSQIIPRRQFETMTVEQKQKLAASAKPVLTAAALQAGSQAGAVAE